MSQSLPPSPFPTVRASIIEDFGGDTVLIAAYIRVPRGAIQPQDVRVSAESNGYISHDRIELYPRAAETQAPVGWTHAPIAR